MFITSAKIRHIRESYVTVSGTITESDANHIRTPHLVICYNTMKKNFKML